MSGPAPVTPLAMPGFGTAAVKGKLARGLTSTGGAGTPADARLVRAELERMPAGALQIMSDNGTKVVACRGDVTDVLAHLATDHPRGYRGGATWVGVPGVFDGANNQVVIATTGHGTPAGPHVPATGEGHGSANLVVHESFHAVDSGGVATPRSTSDADFTAARNADLATLSAYERQPPAGGSNPGAEETYAESAARYFGGDANDAANHPNLHNYWATHEPKP